MPPTVIDGIRRLGLYAPVTPMTAATTDEPTDAARRPVDNAGDRTATAAGATGAPVLPVRLPRPGGRCGRLRVRAVARRRQGRARHHRRRADVIAVDDPAEPGFLAFATPTPTLLVGPRERRRRPRRRDRPRPHVARRRVAASWSSRPTCCSTSLERDVILRKAYAAEGAEALERAIGEFWGSVSPRASR